MKTPTSLLKLKSRFIYWKLNTYTETERNYPVAAHSTIALQPELFRTIKIATACIYYFNAPTKNLIELIDVLDTTIAELKKNTIVTKALSLRVEPVTIETFLKDSKSRYIDAPKALTMFKALALEYHLLYHDLFDFQLGIEGHNKRVLSVFTQNLSTITNAILKYSNG